jgi:hypothetical protein
LNSNVCTTGNYPIYGLIGILIITAVILIFMVLPLLTFDDDVPVEKKTAEDNAAGEEEAAPIEEKNAEDNAAGDKEASC